MCSLLRLRVLLLRTNIFIFICSFSSYEDFGHGDFVMRYGLHCLMLIKVLILLYIKTY